MLHSPYLGECHLQWSLAWAFLELSYMSETILRYRWSLVNDYSSSSGSNLQWHWTTDIYDWSSEFHPFQLPCSHLVNIYNLLCWLPTRKCGKADRKSHNDCVTFALMAYSDSFTGNIECWNCCCKMIYSHVMPCFEITSLSDGNSNANYHS